MMRLFSKVVLAGALVAGALPSAGDAATITGEIHSLKAAPISNVEKANRRYYYGYYPAPYYYRPYAYRPYYFPYYYPTYVYPYYYRPYYGAYYYRPYYYNPYLYRPHRYRAWW